MMKTRWFTRSQREQLERSAMITDGERNRSKSDSIDIDLDMITGEANDHDDDLDLSITSSGRTIERIMEEQASKTTPQKKKAPNGSKLSSLPTGVPAVTATISNPLTIPTMTKSSSRAIPLPSSTHQNNSNSNLGATASHPGSQDSSGSAFLSGILNQSPPTKGQQLSHTPPTAFGTSYENAHFGKRQRAGSVSGRLRSASDLEEKGLIDRQQKGILKDLIICGDEELQQALDKYESGDPAELEAMIRSGALQNKAVPDLDLLGDLDLDLDFLTVNDVIGADAAAAVSNEKEGPGMYSLPPRQQQRQHLKMPQPSQKSAHLTSIIQPPLSLYPSKQRADSTCSSHPNEYHDDGIGELEFTGDFGDYGDDGTATANSSQFAMSQPHNPGGKEHRAISPSLPDDNRLRSNSLFSALINEPKSAEHHDLQYGRWMDRVVAHGNNESNKRNPSFGDMDMADDALAKGEIDRIGATTGNAASRPIPIPKACGKDINNITRDETTLESPDPPKKKGRRKSDTAALEDKQLKARLKQELADQKRREKQEKREQKQRMLLEKREARLLAKAEKKKVKDRKKDESDMVVDEEEKTVHIPGSGRPRSMSDPNFRTRRDEFGLVEIERPDGWVGAYSPESRKIRIEKFLAKRHQRVWTKTVKYDVRKNFADSRLRVKGRFVKKEDEMLMRDLMSIT